VCGELHREEKMEKELPKAIAESQFTLFGINLKCYVLDNGARIIDAKDMESLFEAMQYANALDDVVTTNEELEKFAKWQLGK
jgi:protein associated with RNAse G/E